MGKVIIEGIEACFIILLVCVTGIANGAVGLVHMYEKDVRDRAIELAAAIGTLMRIKPVLQIKGERLDAFAKARTLAQGKTTMINAIHHDIESLYGGIDANDVWMYAVHAQVPEAFESFRAEVRRSFPKMTVEDDRLSLSICCHIGPGALAMACVKKSEAVRGM